MGCFVGLLGFLAAVIVYVLIETAYGKIKLMRSLPPKRKFYEGA